MLDPAVPPDPPVPPLPAVPPVTDPAEPPLPAPPAVPPVADPVVPPVATPPVPPVVEPAVPPFADPALPPDDDPAFPPELVEASVDLPPAWPPSALEFPLPSAPEPSAEVKLSPHAAANPAERTQAPGLKRAKDMYRRTIAFQRTTNNALRLCERSHPIAALGVTRRVKLREDLRNSCNVMYDGSELADRRDALGAIAAS